MKKTKIFSLVLASTVSVSTAVSFSASAKEYVDGWIFSGIEDSVSKIDEYFSDSDRYIDITDYEFLRKDREPFANYMAIDTYDNGGTFYRFENYHDYIVLYNCSNVEKFENIVKSVDDSLVVWSDNWLTEITRVDENGNYMEIPADMARELGRLLEDYASDILYRCNTLVFQHGGCSYFTEYPIENADVLEECVERNNIDAEVVKFDTGREAEKYFNHDILGYPNGSAFIVPNKEISKKEHLDLAELIYEDTGIGVDCMELALPGTIGKQGLNVPLMKVPYLE